MRLLFTNRKYDNVFGGVERSSISLMNEMVERGHNVHLLSWDDENAEAFYEIKPDVRWHKIAIGDPSDTASLGVKIRRAWKIRKIVREIQPDLAVAFQDGPFRSTRAYTLGMGIPVIAAERNSPARFDFIKAGRKRQLIFQSFRLAKQITIQSAAFRCQYPAYLRAKIAVIPNPVIPASAYAVPGSPDENKKILLSIGRLSYQKNHDVLLRAFASIAAKAPNWKLTIVGEGEDRLKLEETIKKLGLGDRVSLLGSIKNVAHYYATSHLFCLPSRWEGFPNALAEAMSHGLPAVGYEGCSGICELIEDGETGFLAANNGDADSLTRILEKAMQQDALRAYMSERAIESMKRYDPVSIFDRWEALFNEATR